MEDTSLINQRTITIIESFIILDFIARHCSIPLPLSNRKPSLEVSLTCSSDLLLLIIAFSNVLFYIDLIIPHYHHTITILTCLNCGNVFHCYPNMGGTIDEFSHSLSDYNYFFLIRNKMKATFSSKHALIHRQI